MSLTTEITGLTTEVRQLVNTVAAQDDLVRDKINQLAAMVPNTSRLYYVDAASGDDAADGTSPQTALASLEAALQRAPAGGRCSVRLLSDVVVSERVGLNASATFIYGTDATGAPVQRQVAFAAQAGTGTAVAGWYHNTGGVLYLSDLDITLPVAAAGMTTRYVIGHWPGGVDVLFRCHVRAAAGSDCWLIGGVAGRAIVDFRSCSIDASAGAGSGRLFEGVAAGADPNSDWRIRTNITAN